MHRVIHRHLLLPAFETLFKRRRTFRYWRELERTQWLPPQEIEARQLQSLRRLLRHAFDHCPYYAREWRKRLLRPESLASLEDFRRWPIIDRSTVAAHRVEMRSQTSNNRLISKSTGGSSGEPLQFDLDHDSNDRRTAAAHRGYGWAGGAPGTNQLYLWGVPLIAQSRLKRTKDQIYNWLYRRRVLNSFDLNESTSIDFLRELDRRSPDILVAYTNALYTWARLLDEHGTRPRPPKAIIVGAEKLYPFQRDMIERVFAAPVFETYGSREFMLIGAECERHEGLHITAENLLVEVLDDDGQATPEGREGNIVITDLYNYGMPFIRYANGDRATAGWRTCSCGRGLPLLREVVGRRLDVLQTPDGRYVPGEFFPHLLKDFPAVKQFQVVQNSPHRVQLLLVAPCLGNDDRVRLTSIARRTLGDSVQLDLMEVHDIPLSPAGKLRVVVNNVPLRKAG